MVAFAASAQTAGAVFVNANSTSNEVWMYTRAANGALTLVGAFPTQGQGGSPGLGSQGGVALANNNKFLYAVNAGSNEISGFLVKPTGLTFVGKVSSGGTFPNSVAASGTLLYALNSQGTSANITGFRIQSNGALRPIPNSTRPLSADLPKPGQVGFTPDGKSLIVTEINTSKIDTYAIGTDGRATGPLVQVSAGAGPFGFAFDNAGHLVISEVTLSSASSYTVSGGLLNVVTGALPDFGKAACWVASTSNPNLPQQYSYITNTGSDTVSGFAITSDGRISLLQPDGKTAVLLPGAFPLDMAISRDSRYLYVLEGKLPGIAVFQINRDGSLTQVQDVRGIPSTSYGMTGY
ncbi:MAG: beta-propeller fold lactonase family protein [Acidobacteriales bacterium]|nr:beta-propeller fold lactonase family protein [Terriglobales bacterium]